MATTSTMVAVKAALVNVLRGRPGLDSVLISYADPGDKGRREQAFFDEVRASEQRSVSMKAGRKRRDEEYELDLVVDVSSKTTPESVESRCLDIVSELEDVLALDPTIGGTDGVLWALVSDLRLKTLETGDGPVCRAIVTITVRGRLL